MLSAVRLEYVSHKISAYVFELFLICRRYSCLDEGLNFLEESTKKEKDAAPKKSNGQSKPAFGSAFGGGLEDDDDEDDFFKEFAVDLDDVAGTSNPPTNEETLNLSAISAGATDCNCDSKALLESSSLNESSDAKQAGHEEPQVTSGETPNNEYEVTLAITDSQTRSEDNGRELNEASINVDTNKPIEPIPAAANSKLEPAKSHTEQEFADQIEHPRAKAERTEDGPPETTDYDLGAKSTSDLHQAKNVEALQDATKKGTKKAFVVLLTHVCSEELLFIATRFPIEILK
ncbi:hypothetical protein BSKO_08867 [Bryopsis sp. KO-2023]|nr:hypothetical protein BSKO_08867 [Bryopsis sp. KO-2023]